MTKKEVKDCMFSLNFVSNTLKVYGEKNDYMHELCIKHLEDVIKLIKNDKEGSPTEELGFYD